MEESYKYYILEAENLVHAQAEKYTSSKYVKWVKKKLKLQLIFFFFLWHFNLFIRVGVWVTEWNWVFIGQMPFLAPKQSLQ